MGHKTLLFEVGVFLSADALEDFVLGSESRTGGAEE